MERRITDEEALDRIADIFVTEHDDDPWPSGADIAEWVYEILRQTGRGEE